MEPKERIRGVHINTASGLISLMVGETAPYVCSRSEEGSKVTKIDKVLGLGPSGAVNVYRVHCEDGDVKERIEIPAEFVALTILEEEK